MIMTLELILKWGVPVLLTAMTGYITNQIKKNKKRDKDVCERNLLINDVLVSLLRSQIVSIAEQFLKQGFLPDYARYTINDLYKNYSNLGANHGIDLLVEQCNELPPFEKGVK